VHGLADRGAYLLGCLVEAFVTGVPGRQNALG
jgi:hypothetical protein